MSTIIPPDITDEVDRLSRFTFKGRAVSQDPSDPEVRTDGASWDGNVLTYSPDLTPAERTTLSDMVKATRYGLPLATFGARKADIAGLTAFMGVPAPTLPQTAAALKALIRVFVATQHDD